MRTLKGKSLVIRNQYKDLLRNVLGALIVHKNIVDVVFLYGNFEFLALII